ncbi:MAG: VacB/RNase II family 3'-5' exoribonuclease [Deltaproteobacteria bacterium]|nr:VacB/RNase II family 3'-5' exoribonuclease [Deltaproteobacteria bacterium]
MKPGFLVEFYDEKRLLCGLVLDLKGDRVQVITQAGRELTLAPKRLLHACPAPLAATASRQQILAHLEETSRKREALKAAINLEDLWDLLAAENQAMTEEEMADLWFGRTSPDEVAAVGRALREDKFLFKHKDNLWLPHPAEVVADLQAQHQRDLERRQEMEEAAVWLQAVWSGEAVPEPRFGSRLVELLKQLAVFGSAAPDYEQGKALLEKARLTIPDAPFRLLVRLGVFDEDEDLDLYRLEAPREFSPQAFNLSRALRESLPPDPYAAQRRDLTGLECITIDGEQTRDFDDALSLEEVPEGWRLGIHIADVASTLAPGTPLDLEARERGTSIYLPERRLPMLPEEISEDTLSLLVHQARRALTFLVTLDPQGEIKDWEITPSLIKVRQRLTYNQVDGLLSQDPHLAQIKHLSRGVKERRLAQGGYELHLPEVWVVFTPQGLQVKVEDQETPSRQLVAEAMVLANRLAAAHLAEGKTPAIYRSQPEPREPMRRKEGKTLFELWQDRRNLSRVVMDLTPQPHWGLGLNCYTMVTSPIRRYLDLVIHRQLLAVLAGGPPAYQREDLEEIINVIDPAMRRAGILKTRRLRYWLLKYLMGKVGQKMPALVLEALPHRCRLMFPELLLEFFFPAPATVKLTPGDTIQVRLDRVSPREDQIKVSLA